MKKLLLLSAALGLVTAYNQYPAETRWTTRGFADFSKGLLDASGANLYVSRNGSVEMIQRFDLNGDGYIDLLFNQTHDYSTRVNSVVYWNAAKGFLESSRTVIPADGGYRALTLDLNGDGHIDLVVVNRFNGTTHRVNSFVYWGTPNGLGLSKPTSLPTLGATGVAAADLNKDGYMDLVFSNGGSLEAYTIGKIDDRASYIYWGGPRGFSATNRTELPGVNPVGVAVADWNGDGLPDILLANSGPESPGIYIYWNSPNGISEGNRQVIRAGNPSAVFTQDLDRDGFPEIVITRKTEESSLVLWNERGKFSAAQSTALPFKGAVGGCAGDLNGNGLPSLVLVSETNSAAYSNAGSLRSGQGSHAGQWTQLGITHATSCAIADLNGDGRPDLALSRYRGEDAFDVPSFILWGGENGISANRRTLLATSGAADVRIADFNGDSRPDLFFANSMSGRTKGDIESYIYWGNAAHEYSSRSRTGLPGRSNYKACAADLNDDGHTDLVLANSWDDEPTGAGVTYIYWGGATGFRPDSRQELLVGGAYGCSIADLNRDGYLDLVFSNVFTKEETAHQPRRDFGDKGGIIYWGGPAGYTFRNRTLLSAKAPMANRVADFDKDGYLDILFTTWQGGDAVIFWGGKDGLSDRNQVGVPAVSSVNAEIADLNHDGYLDLILCNHIDSKTLQHRLNSYIYYGGPGGFSASNRLELPTLGAHDASVADLNGDGALDIVFSNYHADTTRNPPSYIYWGDSSGRYDASRRTELPTYSAAGNLIADLNRDGYPDIVFSNHVVDGDHHVNSFIYWGSSAGYDPRNKTELPSIGPHNMFGVDIGNLYTRKLEEEYQSPLHPIAAGLHPVRLEWQAETPLGTGVRFQIRTAESEETVKRSPWIGANGEATFWTKAGARLSDLRVPANHRWMQYRVLLTTHDGGITPRLREVSVIFEKSR